MTCRTFWLVGKQQCRFQLETAARYRRSFEAGVEPPAPSDGPNRALLEEVRQEMCQEARQEESASSNGSVVSEAPVAGLAGAMTP